MADTARMHLQASVPVTDNGIAIEGVFGYKYVQDSTYMTQEMWEHCMIV
jgi:hypothetical protein